ncbi:MAG TPA: TolC family protein, partial [Burkholderiaceae bacterium]|nr:TolC family protein [Burkholderiaceae bacterium]
LDWAATLHADVDRRWRAGEMARTDANVARTEVQAAEAEVIEAGRGERQAQFAWRTLTGVPPPASLPEEAPGPATAEPVAHPRLVAIDAVIARDRARARLLDKSARDAPELTLRVLREHGSSAEPYANAIGVKLSIPFSAGPRLAGEGAAIAAELAEAEAQAQQLREQLHFEVDGARADLQAAERRLALARTRADLAFDTLQLVQRAFTLGETDLATLLRARAAAFDAEAERERQRIARGSAISQLNQSLGVLP